MMLDVLLEAPVLPLPQRRVFLLQPADLGGQLADLALATELAVLTVLALRPGPGEAVAVIRTGDDATITAGADVEVFAGVAAVRVAESAGFGFAMQQVGHDASPVR
jgi:hypothetical protein